MDQQPQPAGEAPASQSTQLIGGAISDQSSQHEPMEVTQQPRIEDLPLDKKLELLRKYNPYEKYDDGRFIDAQDTVNTWCLGQITEVDQRNIRIHFDGWSPKWDVVSFSSQLLNNNLG